MRLAFWRRAPAAVDWYRIDRSVPYAMAAEMATWPEPIDVIREALSLPPRLRVRVGRAWNAVWSAVRSEPELSMAAFAVGVAMAGAVLGPAGSGNPIHDQALRRARGF